MSRQIARRRDWIFLAGLTALYLLSVAIPSQRFVWYDELLTFDIAKAGSIRQILDLIGRFDLNTPTFYLLSRFSMRLFGQNAFGMRLPSIIEFYVGSVLLFVYCRRKTEDSFAAFGVILLWSSGTFYYATEARPYALMFMCFFALLLCWDSATRTGRPRRALVGVTLSAAGMLLAHGLAPVSLLPVLAAEVTRAFRQKKLDYPMWVALLFPFLAVLTYIPLFHFYGKLLYPVPFQAGFKAIVTFYGRSFDSVSRVVLLTVLAALLIPSAPMEREPVKEGFRAEDLVLFAVLLLGPILLNFELMRGHGAFWDRYCITAQAGIYGGMAVLMGIRLGRSRLAGYAALLIVVIFLLHQDLRVFRLRTPKDIALLEQVRPDLPIVAAGGLTFFEMNHHEDARLLSRLYYLKDRSLSIQYVHTNFFDDFDDFDAMRDFFPITGHVAQYNEFIREHREFLVLGSYNAYEWLLPKLHDENAQILLIKDYAGQTPYIDSGLYLVTLPPEVKSF